MTVYRRNDALLDFLTSEDKCDKFLQALKRTGQPHVVNFVTANGSKWHSVVVIYQSIFTLLWGNFNNFSLIVFHHHVMNRL